MNRTGGMTSAEPMAGAGPVPAPRVVGQRRLRGGQLGLAVALVCVGGLLTGFAFLTTTRAGEYLAVTRPVAAGEALQAADLTTVQMNAGPGLAPVPAGDLRRVLGKRAAVSLVPGTLLSQAQLSDRRLLGEGERQVAVGLKPDRLPARRLGAGAQVQLVATPPASETAAAGTEAAQAGPPETFDATVVDTAGPGEDTTVVVYLAVDEGEAPRIVTLAAADRITMVLKAAR